ncbi:MAG TPA: DUF2190 family protein [Phycisphaerales bacterium]|nr:DUF2190 family protein [Phycisphaerales bacterium]HMP37043.1 DUF2190 family protein [Phycisphaerales bacterium]
MNFSLAPGDRVDYTPNTAIAAGTIVVFGAGVGLADQDIPANQLGALSVRGLKRLVKATGSAITGGAKLYWDAINERVTTTVGSNAYVGIAVPAGAASADTTVLVLMGHAA